MVEPGEKSIESEGYMQTERYNQNGHRPALRIILLAAGTGSRLRPHTENLPKAMIPLPGGQSLLEHTLSVLSSDSQIGEIVIVGGHEYEVLRRYIETRWDGCCRTVFNVDYEVKGPIYSVRCGLAGCPPGSYVAIMNGDTWFSEQALRLMVRLVASAPASTLLFGSPASEFAADDMRIRTYGGRIRRVDKGIEAAQMISAGCCLLPPRAAAALAAMLASIGTRPHPEVKTWHEALNKLLEAGERIEFYSLSRDDWQEIDNERDLEALSHRMTRRRHGGRT